MYGWPYLQETTNRRKEIASIIDGILPEMSVVIDAFCGFAPLFELFSNSNYHGFDISPDAINHLRTIYPSGNWHLCKGENFDLNEFCNIDLYIHMGVNDAATKIKEDVTDLRLIEKFSPRFIIFEAALPYLRPTNYIYSTLIKLKNYHRIKEAVYKFSDANINCTRKIFVLEKREDISIKQSTTETYIAHKTRFEGRVFNYRKSLLPNEYMQRVEDLDSDFVDEYVKFLSLPGDQRISHQNYNLFHYPQVDSSMGYPAWNLLYYNCLCSLREGQENTIVELGTGLGTTAIFLAQALIDSGFRGHVYAIDTDTRCADRSISRWEEAGVKNSITLVQSEAIKFLANFNKTICFANMDTDPYNTSKLLKQFWFMQHLIDKNSILFFNNTYGSQLSCALDKVSRVFGGNLLRFNNCCYYSPGCALWQGEPLTTEKLERIKSDIFYGIF